MYELGPEARWEVIRARDESGKEGGVKKDGVRRMEQRKGNRQKYTVSQKLSLISLSSIDSSRLEFGIDEIE